MGILSAIFALLKAIPALTGLVEKLMGAWVAHSAAERERIANARLETKNTEVDAGIDAALRAHVLDRLRDAGAPGEQPAADGATGLAGGGASGPGVVPRRAEDDQPAGAGN